MDGICFSNMGCAKIVERGLKFSCGSWIQVFTFRNLCWNMIVTFWTLSRKQGRKHTRSQRNICITFVTFQHIWNRRDEIIEMYYSSWRNPPDPTDNLRRLFNFTHHITTCENSVLDGHFPCRTTQGTLRVKCFPTNPLETIISKQKRNHERPKKNVHSIWAGLIR